MVSFWNAPGDFLSKQDSYSSARTPIRRLKKWVQVWQQRFKGYKYDLLFFFWDSSIEENMWILKTMSQKTFKYCYWSSWCNCREGYIDKSHSILYPIQVEICDESLIPHIVIDPGPLWSWKGDFNTSSHHTMAAVLGYRWLWAAPHCQILRARLSLQWGSQDCVSATKSCIRLLTVLRTHTRTEFMHGLTSHRSYKHHPGQWYYLP